MKKAVNLTLDGPTIERIDEIRGMIPRSTIIDELIQRGLKCSDIQVAHIGEKRGDE